MHERGKGGLRVDIGKAAELYRQSADRGDAGGLCCLGKFFEHGKGGVELDLGKARDLYRRAAALGDVFPLAASAAKGRLRAPGWV